MKSKVDKIEQALQASTRMELAEALRPRQPNLSLPDINRLSMRLQSFNEPRQPLKLAILRTYTTELLRPYWTFEALVQGFALDLYEAPYGNLLQESQASSGLLMHQPDVTYLFLQWEDLAPHLNQPLMALSVADRYKVAEDALNHLHTLLSSFRKAVLGSLVITFLPRLFGPELGSYDTMAAESEAMFRHSLKTRLAAYLRTSLPAVYFDDLDILTEEIGRLHMFDFRLWYTSRFPFSVAGAQAVVRRLMCYPILLNKPKAKCIAVDGDNTLWGGIVGEDGPTGIALGQDYPGLAYVAFQRRLLEFQQRGLLLALCSKNNPEDVLEILSQHPHQVLREKHFAALRSNWLPKPDNLRAIAQELNLGLESFVFVDDSPQERLFVQQQLPQVFVVKVPERVTELPFCLDDLPQLEILSLTEEDKHRTKMYARERKRQQLSKHCQNINEYLASLQMVMTIGLNDPRHITRIAQLTQKTNQFNLTTRRYTEAEVQRFIRDPDWLVAYFSLSDIFGDSGIVGAALVRGLTSSLAEVDSFLMSCRVIGRQAESAFLHCVIKTLAEQAVARVKASYIPTPKNKLVKDFWSQHGFRAIGLNVYEIDLPKWMDSQRPPAAIRVQPAVDGPAAQESPKGESNHQD